MLRILVIAEVRLYRDGLAQILAAHADIEVVGNLRHWKDAVPLLAVARPDIVLLEAAPAEKVAAVQQLTQGPGTVQVIALSIGDHDDVVSWAEAGISGFVTRDDSLSDLLAIVRSVTRNEMPCSPRVASALLRRVGALATHRAGLDVRLTVRELEVLGLIERGLSNKEVGRALCIQLATVKNHVHNILEKLQVTRRADAVAVARGLTGPHPELRPAPSAGSGLPERRSSPSLQ
ncbi:response regulator transcription factor [Streptomyces flaveus]|uniref:response regulator transcription factor n=1 Tax=Streptomyces flaveus TaxID=66370 RepID=UPI0033203E81